MHKWLIFSIFVVYYNHTYISPLEQVRNLCATAHRSQKSVKASFVSFFMDAMIGVLTISRRINFLQLARYCKSCEQRFRQNFRKTFDWIAFNRFFVDKHPGHRYIAIDTSFVSKSGKHTPGISYFWSGCAQAEQFGSDFVFVTHFPSQHRAFYAMDDPEGPTLTLSFDLLMRGLEITSSGQRIHKEADYREKMLKRGMNPDNFRFYLDTFKNGMPPHGGFAIGLERITACFLGINNVKECSMFPRDINRVAP